MDYIKPNMEVIWLDTEEDVIRTSGGGLGTGNNPDEGGFKEL